MAQYAWSSCSQVQPVKAFHMTEQDKNFGPGACRKSCCAGWSLTLVNVYMTHTLIRRLRSGTENLEFSISHSGLNASITDAECKFPVWLRNPHLHRMSQSGGWLLHCQYRFCDRCAEETKIMEAAIAALCVLGQCRINAASVSGK